MWRPSARASQRSPGQVDPRRRHSHQRVDLFQRRVVDAALGSTAVQGVAIDLVERRVIAQAPHQIGVGDVIHTEGDGVGLAFAERAFGQRAVVAVVDDPAAVELRPT